MATQLKIGDTVKWAGITLPTGAVVGYAAAALLEGFTAVRISPQGYQFMSLVGATFPLFKLYIQMLGFTHVLVKVPAKPGPAIIEAPIGSVGQSALPRVIRWNSANKVKSLVFDRSVKLLGHPSASEQPTQAMPSKFIWPVRVPSRRTGHLVRIELGEDFVLQFLSKVQRRQNRGEPHPMSEKALVGVRFAALNRRLDTLYYDGIYQLLVAHKVCTRKRQGAAAKLEVPPHIALRRLKGLPDSWCMN